MSARKPLRYGVIVAAVGGESEAMTAVLNHFDGYIRAFAKKKIYDRNGNQIACYDELRERLETKLLHGICKFTP
jgi:hypothetical protein